LEAPTATSYTSPVTEHGVQDRVVIVTGAGQGIGRGIARHLARNGARVVVAEWKEHKLQRTVDELQALGVETLGVVCDVQRQESIQAMVAATVARFGRVDALVNNAQTFRAQAPVEEISGEDAGVFWTSGPLGTLWAMQAVFPHMRAQGWGRIVNVGSAAAFVGLHGYGAYAMSKEAIRAVTRTAAREWGRHGIVVNCFCPGAASARGTAGVERAAEQGRALVFERCIDRLGDPEDDIAPVVLFLCSDACRYLTGQTLMVDGGAFLWA
jgi:NAD(P)-dependent dehydrogenase (short-subunit alcohol dehydrogenase family)